MLSIGDQFPQYSLKSVSSTDGQFPVRTNASSNGRWQIYVFWPKDFTFVCPTEIVGFDGLVSEFSDREADLIGASTDSEFVHLAWRKSREDLAKVRFPWLSDIRKDLSRTLGILEPTEEVSRRATFIVDPQGVIRFASVTDMSVGRNPQEVLRVLDALQTDELCPCNWKPGEETIHVG